ncbi:hypothetical protein STRDD11_01318 [Streptococcus sp. DD11]|nr:hypothetical protein STRDD11_01318 [Streptococcus sp. DD11]
MTSNTDIALFLSFLPFSPWYRSRPALRCSTPADGHPAVFFPLHSSLDA